MKIKYNEEEYVNLCLENEKETVLKAGSKWKGLILFDLVLFAINLFLLYLTKLPSMFQTVYLLFCILVMSFQVYLANRYQKTEEFKILLIYSIVSTLIVILTFMFFITLVVAIVYLDKNKPEVDIFFKTFIITSVVNIIVLLASLYHHNQYMILNDYKDDKKTKKTFSYILIAFLVTRFYKYIKRYNFILVIIFIVTINPINYYLSSNIIRCKRLLKFNNLEYKKFELDI